MAVSITRIPPEVGDSYTTSVDVAPAERRLSASRPLGVRRVCAGCAPAERRATAGCAPAERRASAGCAPAGLRASAQQAAAAGAGLR
ncbi:hypothetical protein, partial [Mycobacterium sp.]|uniref:hypothetical protein n=1 Tax=Mycobacterium sp. TaxID=1785 RepID=UPI0026361367